MANDYRLQSSRSTPWWNIAVRGLAPTCSHGVALDVAYVPCRTGFLAGQALRRSPRISAVPLRTELAITHHYDNRPRRFRSRICPLAAFAPLREATIYRTIHAKAQSSRSILSRWSFIAPPLQLTVTSVSNQAIASALPVTRSAASVNAELRPPLFSILVMSRRFCLATWKNLNTRRVACCQKTDVERRKRLNIDVSEERGQSVLQQFKGF
jgi:hypothetical protein